MSVPAFLILDAFNSDIDVLELYKRWQGLEDKVVELEGLSKFSNALTAFIVAILTSNTKTYPSR